MIIASPQSEQTIALGRLGARSWLTGNVLSQRGRRSPISCMIFALPACLEVSREAPRRTRLDELDPAAIEALVHRLNAREEAVRIARKALRTDKTDKKLDSDMACHPVWFPRNHARSHCLLRNAYPETGGAFSSGQQDAFRSAGEGMPCSRVKARLWSCAAAKMRYKPPLNHDFPEGKVCRSP